MSADPIGPGDFVECIYAEDQGRVGPNFEVGSVYVVEDVCSGAGCECGRPAHFGLFIKDMPDPDGFAYCGLDFRPLPPRPWMQALLTITTDSKADQPETVGVG